MTAFFADLTRQLNAAHERLMAVAQSITDDPNPKGTKQERMAHFAAADDEYRRLNAEWHRAFHDAAVE